MKVSAVIKTPVRVVFEEQPFQAAIFNELGKVAELRTRNEANSVAHCINSHDALVDMVTKLRDMVITYRDLETHPKLVAYLNEHLREADELLKGEQ